MEVTKKWEHFDETVQQIYERPHVGIQDLLNGGLTYDFDAYGSTVLTYEDISDVNEEDIPLKCLFLFDLVKIVNLTGYFISVAS